MNSLGLVISNTSFSSRTGAAITFGTLASKRTLRTVSKLIKHAQRLILPVSAIEVEWRFYFSNL